MEGPPGSKLLNTREKGQYSTSGSPALHRNSWRRASIGGTNYESDSSYFSSAPRSSSARPLPEISGTNTFLEKFQVEVFVREMQRYLESVEMNGIFSRNSLTPKTYYTAEDMLSFQKEPIPTSLLRLSSGLTSGAIKLFQIILKYMLANLPSGNTVDLQEQVALVLRLYKHTIKNAELRDELFAQIFKQTRNNPDRSLLVKAWELMYICASAMPPGKDIGDHLMEYVENVAKDKKHDQGLQRMALNTLGALKHSTKVGPRLTLPTQEEIEAFLTGRRLMAVIYFLDETFSEISYGMTTTVIGAVEEVAARIKLSTPNSFGLFELRQVGTGSKTFDGSNEEHLFLDESRYIGDIVFELNAAKHGSKSEVQQSKLIFKRRFFTESDEAITDPKILQLSYIQLRYDFMLGNYPMGEEDLVHLGALQLLADVGPSDDSALNMDFPGLIFQYLPTQMALTRSRQEWASSILSQYDELPQFSKDDAKKEFMRILGTLPYGRSVFFDVRKMEDPIGLLPGRVVLGINRQGVHFLRPVPKAYLHSAGLRDIMQFGSSSTAVFFKMRVGGALNIFQFETKQGEDICAVIQAHISEVMFRRTSKSRVAPNGDFQTTGDLVQSNMKLSGTDLREKTTPGTPKLVQTTGELAQSNRKSSGIDLHEKATPGTPRLVNDTQKKISQEKAAEKSFDHECFLRLEEIEKMLVEKIQELSDAESCLRLRTSELEALNLAFKDLKETKKTKETEELENNFNKEREMLQAQLADFQKSLTERMQEIRELENSLSSSTSEIEALQAQTRMQELWHSEQIEALGKKYSHERNALSLRLAETENKLHEHTHKLNAAESSLTLRNSQLEDLQDTIKQLEHRKMEEVTLSNSFKQEREMMQSQLADTEKSLREQMQELSEMKHSLFYCTSELEGLQAKTSMQELWQREQSEALEKKYSHERDVLSLRLADTENKLHEFTEKLNVAESSLELRNLQLEDLQGTVKVMEQKQMEDVTLLNNSKEERERLLVQLAGVEKLLQERMQESSEMKNSLSSRISELEAVQAQTIMQELWQSEQTEALEKKYSHERDGLSLKLAEAENKLQERTQKLDVAEYSLAFCNSQLEGLQGTVKEMEQTQMEVVTLLNNCNQEREMLQVQLADVEKSLTELMQEFSKMGNSLSSRTSELEALQAQTRMQEDIQREQTEALEMKYRQEQDVLSLRLVETDNKLHERTHELNAAEFSLALCNSQFEALQGSVKEMEQREMEGIILVNKIKQERDVSRLQLADAENSLNEMIHELSEMENSLASRTSELEDLQAQTKIQELWQREQIEALEKKYSQEQDVLSLRLVETENNLHEQIHKLNVTESSLALCNSQLEDLQQDVKEMKHRRMEEIKAVERTFEQEKNLMRIHAEEIEKGLSQRTTELSVTQSSVTLLTSEIEALKGNIQVQELDKMKESKEWERRFTEEQQMHMHHRGELKKELSERTQELTALESRLTSCTSQLEVMQGHMKELEELRQMEKESKEWERRFTEEQEMHMYHRGELKKELSERTQELTALESHLTLCTSQLEVMQGHMKELEELRQIKEETKALILKLESDQEVQRMAHSELQMQLTKQIQELNVAKSFNTKLTSECEVLRGSLVELEELRKMIKIVEKSHDQANEERNSLILRLNEAEISISNNSQESAVARYSLALRTSELEDLQRSLQLQELRHTEELAEMERTMSHLTKELEVAESRRLLCHSDLEALQNSFKERQEVKKMEENKALESKHEQQILRHRLEDIENLLAKRTEELSLAETSLSVCKTEREALENREEMNQDILRSQLADTEKKLSERDHELTAAESALALLTSQLQALQSNVKSKEIEHIAEREAMNKAFEQQHEEERIRLEDIEKRFSEQTQELSAAESSLALCASELEALQGSLKLKEINHLEEVQLLEKKAEQEKNLLRLELAELSTKLAKQTEEVREAESLVSIQASKLETLLRSFNELKQEKQVEEQDLLRHQIVEVEMMMRDREEKLDVLKSSLDLRTSEVEALQSCLNLQEVGHMEENQSLKKNSEQEKAVLRHQIVELSFKLFEQTEELNVAKSSRSVLALEMEQVARSFKELQEDKDLLRLQILETGKALSETVEELRATKFSLIACNSEIEALQDSLKLQEARHMEEIESFESNTKDEKDTLRLQLSQLSKELSERTEEANGARSLLGTLISEVNTLQRNFKELQDAKQMEEDLLQLQIDEKEKVKRQQAQELSEMGSSFAVCTSELEALRQSFKLQEATHMEETQSLARKFEDEKDSLRLQSDELLNMLSGQTEELKAVKSALTICMEEMEALQVKCKEIQEAKEREENMLRSQQDKMEEESHVLNLQLAEIEKVLSQHMDELTAAKLSLIVYASDLNASQEKYKTLQETNQTECDLLKIQLAEAEKAFIDQSEELSNALSSVTRHASEYDILQGRLKLQEDRHMEELDAFEESFKALREAKDQEESFLRVQLGDMERILDEKAKELTVAESSLVVHSLEMEALQNMLKLKEASHSEEIQSLKKEFQSEKDVLRLELAATEKNLFELTKEYNNTKSSLDVFSLEMEALQGAFKELQDAKQIEEGLLTTRLADLEKAFCEQEEEKDLLRLELAVTEKNLSELTKEYNNTKSSLDVLSLEMEALQGAFKELQEAKQIEEGLLKTRLADSEKAFCEQEEETDVLRLELATTEKNLLGLTKEYNNTKSSLDVLSLEMEALQGACKELQEAKQIEEGLLTTRLAELEKAFCEQEEENEALKENLKAQELRHKEEIDISVQNHEQEEKLLRIQLDGIENTLSEQSIKLNNAESALILCASELEALHGRYKELQEANRMEEESLVLQVTEQVKLLSRKTEELRISESSLALCSSEIEDLQANIKSQELRYMEEMKSLEKKYEEENNVLTLKISDIERTVSQMTRELSIADSLLALRTSELDALHGSQKLYESRHMEELAEIGKTLSERTQELIVSESSLSASSSELEILRIDLKKLQEQIEEKKTLEKSLEQDQDVSRLSQEIGKTLSERTQELSVAESYLALRTSELEALQGRLKLQEHRQIEEIKSLERKFQQEQDMLRLRLTEIGKALSERTQELIVAESSLTIRSSELEALQERFNELWESKQMEENNLKVQVAEAEKKLLEREHELSVAESCLSLRTSELEALQSSIKLQELAQVEETKALAKKFEQGQEVMRVRFAEVEAMLYERTEKLGVAESSLALCRSEVQDLQGSLNLQGLSQIEERKSLENKFVQEQAMKKLQLAEIERKLSERTQELCAAESSLALRTSEMETLEAKINLQELRQMEENISLERRFEQEQEGLKIQLAEAGKTLSERTQELIVAKASLAVHSSELEALQKNFKGLQQIRQKEEMKTLETKCEQEQQDVLMSRLAETESLLFERMQDLIAAESSLALCTSELDSLQGKLKLQELKQIEEIKALERKFEQEQDVLKAQLAETGKALSERTEQLMAAESSLAVCSSELKTLKGSLKGLQETKVEQKFGQELNVLRTRLFESEKLLYERAQELGMVESSLALRTSELEDLHIQLKEQELRQIEEIKAQEKKFGQGQDTLRRKLTEVENKLSEQTHLLRAAERSLSLRTNEIEDLQGRLQELKKTTEVMDKKNRENAATISSQADQLTELEELYREEQFLRKQYYNLMQDMKGKIRVYARWRPLLEREIADQQKIILLAPDQFTLQHPWKDKPKQYHFDHVFDDHASQETVFEDTKYLVQSAVDGYNVCIFAYGQTGSGKTFTIYGTDDNAGLTPRAVQELFNILKRERRKFSFSLKAYMLELYQDFLIDLLLPKHSKKKKLEIRKDNKGMVVVENATLLTISTKRDLEEIFTKGLDKRHTHGTVINAESSRSHLILSIVIESTNLQTKTVHKGKLSFVDLAGSERVKKSGSAGEQLKEAQSINKSLSALGGVISALAIGVSHIPYRNHKLTQLMSDSLGGNAKTLMFVNLSPTDANLSESYDSLRYATRVRTITNQPNESTSNEVVRLKTLVNYWREQVEEKNQKEVKNQEEEMEAVENESLGEEDSVSSSSHG
ncbi:hypothetical protein O6H91_05G018800 [Diphasiastrum complanatum]|uniref:Uncharacterized protein n=1 Tax=Diphasiastrum complanatum TaxID=34168 RepID=A0ACC2DL46_DIPCM|nr:hypothetical protein O6H91_05G018800 [Diphasiastrum complanatum]